MTQPTDNPRTWFDTSTKDGEVKAGAAQAEKGWSAPVQKQGQSYDAYQNELTGFNSVNKT